MNFLSGLKNVSPKVWGVWIAIAVFFALMAYLVGVPVWLAPILGVAIVVGAVGGATYFMYRRQQRLLENALKFDIDLKSGKIHPANLRRMYFSGGQNRKDALFIASQAMNCSVQEAEKQLSQKMSKPR